MNEDVGKQRCCHVWHLTPGTRLSFAVHNVCSAVFQRPEGKLLSYFGLIPVGHVLDVPNAVLGALYYAWLLLVPHFIPKEELGGNGGRDLVLLITRAMAALAFATTVVLAYCLTFVVYDLCLLCWTAHAINATLVYRLVWRGDTLDVRNDARSGSTPAKAKKA